jgi:ribosome-associated protein
MNAFSMEQPPSRSAKKRAAKAVEETAADLVVLGDADFRRLTLAGEILEAVDEVRRIKAHSARKRQLKHLAGLLRRDEDSLQQAETFLADLAHGRQRAATDFHFLEELRERLCDPARFDEALEEVRRELPEADAGKLRRLAESVRNHKDKRAFRELFRLLKEAHPGHL